MTYEALIFTAHLPSRTVTFVYPERGIPFAGGVYRIERVRAATEQDKKDFPEPPEGCCPMCGQKEPE